MSGGNLEAAAGGSPRPSAVDAAALWVVQCRDGADVAELDRWLEEDADHVPAYADAMAVWADLGSILPDWRLDITPPVPPPPPAVQAMARWRLAMAGVLASVLGIGLLGFQWVDRPTVFETAVGEQRQVTLVDGSRVTLNTNSRLRVERFGAERRVVQERGEIYFDVEHDAVHPFEVVAGGRSVRVLGTSFIVQRDAEHLAVTLLSGSVVVFQPAASTVRLQPGDRFVARQDGRDAHVDRPRIEAVTAWRRGEMLLDKTSLADAVTEMNRYSDRPIVLADPALGRLQLSGVFKTGESASFAQTVASIFRLKVEARPRELRISQR